MSIRMLSPDDTDLLTDYVYSRERENIFSIESLKRPEAFSECIYIGAFNEGSLTGLATYFGRHRSLVIHADDAETLQRLSDAFVALNKPLEAIPDWGQYAAHVIERLKHHGIHPKNVSEETIFELSQSRFKDSRGTRARLATTADIDDILTMGRIADGKDTSARISDNERSIVIPAYLFVVCNDDGEIVAQAGIHGYSKRYAQIGNVLTLPAYRGKGYGKDAVSAVCRHWLAQGKIMILFCRNDNEPAKKIYESLGFKPSDPFLLAMY